MFVHGRVYEICTWQVQDALSLSEHAIAMHNNGVHSQSCHPDKQGNYGALFTVLQQLNHMFINRSAPCNMVLEEECPTRGLSDWS